MKTVNNLSEISTDLPCAMALGTFDGLHRGHMAVIKAAVQEKAVPAIFTFENSPSGMLSVLTPRDKSKLLEAAGVKLVYSPEFEKVKEILAEDFAKKILIAKCRAKTICCGEDFRFGKDAAGDIELLSKICAENGINLKILSAVLYENEKISSTRIRKAVEAGEIRRANYMLGRPFGFSLEVIHGNHIGGPLLGTPTINQAVPKEVVQPRFGVYASWARVSGKYYYGVTNIGVKPTVGSDSVLSETWLPDFSGDLYGRRVRLYLLEFIRPEKKFSSLAELKEEIGKNAKQAKLISKRDFPPLFGETTLQNAHAVVL